MRDDALIPCRGVVTVRLDGAVVARSARALITAAIEADAELLLPAADVAEGAPATPDDRKGPGGEALVAFDRHRAAITIDDRWTADGGSGTVNVFPRWGDMRDLVRLMDVQPVGPGAFRAPTYGDVRRNVIEGGQLLGQAIVAAAKSVPDKHVISAHIVLSRPAGFDRPIDLAVAPHRLGRSFATLGVELRQAAKPIASALVLMDRGAPDLIRGHAAMPDVPGPEAATFFDYGITGRESRFVGGDYDPDPDRIGPPELHCWVRHREAPAALHLRQALIAQSCSHFTIAAAMLPHAGFGEALAHRTLSTGVLTVTLAFHEDADITDWLLYTNPAIHAGHGLAQGQARIFARDGRLVASYTAQVMIRGLDDTAEGVDAARLM